MSSVSYPEWIEYCWIASDRDGRVAVFTTAGIGPIPVKALEYNPPNAVNEWTAILKMPIITTAYPAISYEDDDEAIDMAKRGFFTYDWSDVHRTRKTELRAYEPTSAPADPITVDMLPAELVHIATAARFANVAFSLNELLDVRAHLECCESEFR